MTKVASTTQKKPARFLIVGLGPHAKRTYAKHLVSLKTDDSAELVCAVDVESKKGELTAYRDAHLPGVELAFVPPFTTEMPQNVTRKLNMLLSMHGIDCVIISTEPQAHQTYGLWAVDRGLHVIMDKPVTTRKGAATDMAQALGIAQDYQDLMEAYSRLQRHRQTIFLIASHRRYHPAYTNTSRMLRDIARKTGSPVTNIVSTHCDGQWRLPHELVDEAYHGFNAGHGKVSHSGYHFLDTAYQFVKAGWSELKRPDKVQVVSSFISPSGVLKTLTHGDYVALFGDEYVRSCKYTPQQVESLVADFGEYDANIQMTFLQDDEPVTLVQLNLLHNGFSRRSWVTMGNSADWYKGSGRVKHEAHEIRSGPFQTIVLESRQANDKHDRSKPSTAEIGTDNHFQVYVFRNCRVLGESQPLKSYSMEELDRRGTAKLPGVYSENVKKGIIQEAIDYLQGEKKLEQLVSNLEDHSVPTHLMSAAYASHILRTRGDNPIVTVGLSNELNGT